MLPETDAALPVETAGPRDSWTMATLACGTALALVAALQTPDDRYHAGQLAWVTLALLLILPAVAGARWEWIERRGRLVLGTMLTTGMAVQLVLLAAKPPRATEGVAMPIGFTPLLAIAAGTAALMLPALFSSARWWRRVQGAAFAALLVMHLLLGTWTIRAVPFTTMDVYVVQTDSAEALIHGYNPYRLTFLDSSGGTSPFYAPGVQRNGRLMVGYWYMPLSLLLATPGMFLGDDIRYAQLVCITISAGLIGIAQRSSIAIAAAAMLLLTPSGFWVISQGWTEPFIVLTLALVLYAHCRRPRATAWMLGLFWAIKQHMSLFVPLTLLLLPRPLTARQITLYLLKGFSVAAVLTLPFALWDFPAFWRSVITLQLMQPFREDALTYSAAVYRLTGIVLPSVIGFMLLVAVEALGLRRAPRTAAGFALTTAAGMLVFCAFNRQAFVNYYYFIIAASFFTAATAAPAEQID